MSLFDRVPLPMDLAGAIDALRHTLFDEGVSVYVLFDPLLGMSFDRPWSENGLFPAEHVIPLTQWGLPVESSPYFLQIDRPLSYLLDETLAVAMNESASGIGARSICGWFTSPHPTGMLRSALLKQIQQRDGSGNRWMFRFYDPRVMQHLDRVIGSSFALAGISRWFFLDANSNLTSLSGVPEIGPPVVVGDASLSQLDRIKLVNQAHAQWQRVHSCVPENAFELLFKAAEQAVESGLDIAQTADCVSFMLHRCLVHPDIERHPQVADWLAGARQGRRSYADAAAAASPAVWDDITSGHWIQARQGAHHG